MPHGAWPTSPSTTSRRKLGAIADHVYGRPSRSLFVVGVTGTNGKTSCTHWIAQCLDACGRKSGILGTLGNGLVGALDASARTTPDAAEVHETLARFRDAGAKAVAMEVSSHGLEQGRVNAVEFDVALFTNLTRDHLDYHGTMAAYGAAKAGLFAWPTLEACVINADDPFGRTLADTARARGQQVLTYGLANAGADVAATRLATTPAGIELTIATPWGRGDVALRLSGAFNASNVLGVLGVLLASDVEFDAALAALARVDAAAGTHAAPGRRSPCRSSWSTTRTRRTRSRRCSPHCGPPSPRAARSSASSAAAAIATPASGRRWAASRRCSPTASS